MSWVESRVFLPLRYPSLETKCHHVGVPSDLPPPLPVAASSQSSESNGVPVWLLGSSPLLPILSPRLVPLPRLSWHMPWRAGVVVCCVLCVACCVLLCFCVVVGRCRCWCCWCCWCCWWCWCCCGVVVVLLWSCCGVLWCVVVNPNGVQMSKRRSPSLTSSIGEEPVRPSKSRPT